MPDDDNDLHDTADRFFRAMSTFDIPTELAMLTDAGRAATGSLVPGGAGYTLELRPADLAEVRLVDGQPLGRVDVKKTGLPTPDNCRQTWSQQYVLALAQEDGGRKVDLPATARCTEALSGDLVITDCAIYQANDPMAGQ